MRTQLWISTYKPIVAGLIVLLATTSSSATEASKTNSVTRIYGADGGYRTEVASETVISEASTQVPDAAPASSEPSAETAIPAPAEVPAEQASQ